MSDVQETNHRRAEIAARNRRRALEERERKYSMAVFGLMGYCAFSNLLGGVLALGSSLPDACVGAVIGALYALGAYRVWSKDDTRWWPVAVPAGIALVVLLLAWVGGGPRPVPILLNAVLLVLVPLRRRAAEAVPGKSVAAEGHAAAPLPVRQE